MATELKRWLQYRDRYKDSEYCFCTIRGTQLHERSFESNFTVYGERIGKRTYTHICLEITLQKDF